MQAIRERSQWLSGYGLQKLTAGFSKCDGVNIGSASVQLASAWPSDRRGTRLVAEVHPWLKRRGVLWSPSYFAASCNGAPIEIIRQYIEPQRAAPA